MQIQTFSPKHTDYNLTTKQKNNTNSIPAMNKETYQFASCAKEFSSFRNNNHFFSSQPVMQLAGPFSSLMPQHVSNNPAKYNMGFVGETPVVKSDYTYHHIIPEEDWRKVYQIIKTFSRGRETVNTFMETGRNWTLEVQLRDLGPRINKILQTDIVTTDLLRPLLKQELVNKKIQYFITQDSLEPVLNESLSEPLGSYLDSNSKSKYNQLFQEGKIYFNKEDYTHSDQGGKNGYFEELEARMCWIIGNIHEGPLCTYRIEPPKSKKSKSPYDPMRDDGGDKFEQSAIHVLSNEHMNKLIDLYEDVKIVLEKFSSLDQQKKEELIDDMFTRMNELMDQKYLTLFNQDVANKWHYDKATNKMRF